MLRNGYFPVIQTRWVDISHYFITLTLNAYLAVISEKILMDFFCDEQAIPWLSHKSKIIIIGQVYTKLLMFNWNGVFLLAAKNMMQIAFTKLPVVLDTMSV